jgi:hypothetical protein
MATSRFEALVDEEKKKLLGPMVSIQSARDPISHAANCGKWEGLTSAVDLFKRATRQVDTEDNER